MKIIYTACAALALSSLVSFASVADAGVNKPVWVNHVTEVPNDNTTNHRVPEPATLILLGSGLVGLGAAKVLKKK